MCFAIAATLLPAPTPKQLQKLEELEKLEELFEKTINIENTAFFERMTKNFERNFLLASNALFAMPTTGNAQGHTVRVSSSGTGNAQEHTVRVSSLGWNNSGSDQICKSMIKPILDQINSSDLVKWYTGQYNTQPYMLTRELIKERITAEANTKLSNKINAYDSKTPQERAAKARKREIQEKSHARTKIKNTQKLSSSIKKAFQNLKDKLSQKSTPKTENNPAKTPPSSKTNPTSPRSTTYRWRDVQVEIGGNNMTS